MDTRFLIFGIVSTVFVAGIYSSSSTALGAKDLGISTSCTATSSTTTVCTTVDSKYKDVSQWKCTTSDGGKTWSCSKAAAGKEAMPPELKNALDAAIQEEPQNTAKVPKSGLDDGSLLTEGSQSSNNTSNDNPKTPKVPNDLGGLNDNGG